MSHYWQNQNVHKLYFPLEKNTWTLKNADDYLRKKLKPKSQCLERNLIAKFSLIDFYMNKICFWVVTFRKVYHWMKVCADHWYLIHKNSSIAMETLRQISTFKKQRVCSIGIGSCCPQRISSRTKKTSNYQLYYWVIFLQQISKLIN